MALQIESKVFAPNERLPSVRELMKQENISLTTASRVFQMLETEGKVYARPRSGFFVRPKRTSARPGEVHALASDVIARRGAGVGSGNWLPDRQLTVAQMATTHRPPSLQMVLNRVLKAIASDTTKNHLEGVPENGLRELRCGVARVMDRRDVTCGPDDIIITSCITSTVEVALRAVTLPGDTIATDQASQACYRTVLESLRLNVIVVASDPASGIDIPTLRQLVESRALRAVLLQPLRMTESGVIPDYHRLSVIELIEQAGIVLIEDDPYHDAYPGAARLATFKSLDRNDRVVYCSSFAPLVGAGYQIGWCIAGMHTENALRVVRDRGTYGCTLPQLVLAELLRKGYYAAHVKGLHAAKQANPHMLSAHAA